MQTYVGFSFYFLCRPLALGTKLEIRYIHVLYAVYMDVAAEQ
jgi:hypothetical protein